MTRVAEALNLVFHGIKTSERSELFADVRHWLAEMDHPDGQRNADDLVSQLVAIDGPCDCNSALCEHWQSEAGIILTAAIFRADRELSPAAAHDLAYADGYNNGFRQGKQSAYGCLFCGKDKLRVYRLPDSESRHLFCGECGAAGPWGETPEEARTLYEAARAATTPVVAKIAAEIQRRFLPDHRTATGATATRAEIAAIITRHFAAPAFVLSRIAALAHEGRNITHAGTHSLLAEIEEIAAAATTSPETPAPVQAAGDDEGEDDPLDNDAVDKELRRWQDAIRDKLIDLGAPDHLIDGAGCDSGDPLDFTLVEVGQGIRYFIDQLDELKEGKPMTTKEAMDHLRLALQSDPEYAWGWHCNIAMAAFDEGMDRDAANRAAARFMKNCFGVDTPRRTEWPDVIGEL